MSAGGGKTYRPWESQRYRQQAHSPVSKLPEGDLVFFLLDVVPKLDLSPFYAPYEQERRGGPPFDPAMMVCLLLYASRDDGVPLAVCVLCGGVFEPEDCAGM